MFYFFFLLMGHNHVWVSVTHLVINPCCTWMFECQRKQNRHHLWHEYLDHLITLLWLLTTTLDFLVHFVFYTSRNFCLFEHKPERADVKRNRAAVSPRASSGVYRTTVSWIVPFIFSTEPRNQNPKMDSNEPQSKNKLFFFFFFSFLLLRLQPHSSFAPCWRGKELQALFFCCRKCD